MADKLAEALANEGPLTVETLAERLPHFPPAAIQEALEALTGQGVLERTLRPDGTPEYRYVAPERYAQINLEVIRNPGDPRTRRKR